MAHRLDVCDLSSGALPLKPVGESDFQVEVCDAPVGQIIRRKRSFGRVVWFWSLSGPHIPETMSAAGSNAQTFEGARQAVKRAFDDWLRLATGQPGNILWDKSLPNR
jgi:hypothetical protein